jgi:hypothetical protein
MPNGLRKFIFKCGGTMVVLLGILHLAVTPIIARLIKTHVAGEVAEWLAPPMLLNHILVGILLLPLGVLIYFAAPWAVLGERWAVIVTRIAAGTMAALPIVLFLLMGSRYFEAVPFVAATMIVCAAALLLLAAAYWPVSHRPSQSRKNR